MKNLGTAVLALTVMGVCGCGGAVGSKPAPSAGAGRSRVASREVSLSKAVLIAKADGICYGVNARRASVTFSSAGDYARLIPPLARYEQAAVAELAGLVPPASMSASWRQIVAGARTMAELTGKTGEIAASDPKGLEKTQSLTVRFTEAERAMVATAKREGFKDCARW